MLLRAGGGVARGFGQTVGGGRGGRRFGVRGTDGDDAGAKLNADGDVVMGGEAAFAEADGEARLAAS